METKEEKIEELKELYNEIEDKISDRMAEFKHIYNNGGKKDIFRELCFCILSSGVGPVIARRSVEALDDILLSGNETEMSKRIDGIHLYPEKAGYLYSTREYLVSEYELELKKHLSDIGDRNERRDFLARNKNIKGIGYLQASHFLRNTGFKGYAILDKNILSALYDLSVITDTKPPNSMKRYLETEDSLRKFAAHTGIDIDHMDLLLWYRIRGSIPR